MVYCSTSNYGGWKMQMIRDAAIFDMDGTLCNVNGVRHYVTGRSKNFDAFHRSSIFCPPNPGPRMAARCYARAGMAIIIVTARDARYESVTRDWLAKHEVPYNAIFMRSWGDTRPDSVVKGEILQRIIDSNYYPVVAYDDRDDIIAVWQAAGIRTVKVCA
jgi:phosphoglycolate phosphatase-like HAD superfamily hydrolase